MARIILIETSTSLCSAALAEDGKAVAYKESNAPRMHASMTAPYIEEVLKSCGLSVTDCDAVCVSMGPGSYTGLRVGSSTAKGLCFGAGIPLIALGTPDILAAQARIDGAVSEDCKYIVPMIDARRMEVYSAIFTPDGRRLSETEPVIVTEESFSRELSEGKVLFIGDGAGKCSTVINSANASFVQCCPRADAMAAIAEEEYKQKRFKDIAYFEPFYLKEFTATVSSRKLF